MIFRDLLYFGAKIQILVHPLNQAVQTPNPHSNTTIGSCCNFFWSIVLSTLVEQVQKGGGTQFISVKTYLQFLNALS